MTTHTFYRGDTRTREEIQLAGGFHPRVQIAISEVRKMLTNGGKQNAPTVSIPETADVLHKAYKAKSNWSLADLAREIKREKSSTTCHVSTDITQECGGYASGNIYKIEIADMHLNGTDEPAIKNWSPLVARKHCANAASIDDATILGIACGGNEVAFLTPIPWANIVAYKAKGQASFVSCVTVD